MYTTTSSIQTPRKEFANHIWYFYKNFEFYLIEKEHHHRTTWWDANVHIEQSLHITTMLIVHHLNGRYVKIGLFCGLKSIVSETFWIYIICIASLANTCFHYIVRQTTHFRTSMFFCKITKNHQRTFFWGWPVQIEQVIRQCQCFMNIVLRGISKNWCFVWMKAVIKPVQYRRYCGLCRPKWHQLLGCPVDIL